MYGIWDTRVHTRTHRRVRHPLLLAYLIAVLLPVPQILPREEKMAEFVDKFKNFHEAFMAEFQ